VATVGVGAGGGPVAGPAPVDLDVARPQASGGGPDHAPQGDEDGHLQGVADEGVARHRRILAPKSSKWG